MKLCKNCKHYNGRGDCHRWQFVEPVNGETRIPWIIARVERESALRVPGCNSPDPCGPDGKHWEEAPPKPATPVKLPWWKRLLNLENS